MRKDILSSFYGGASRWARLGILVVMMACVCIAASAQQPAASGAGMFISVREGMIDAKDFPHPVDVLKQIGVNSIELTLGRDFSVRTMDTGEKVILTTDDDVKTYRANIEKLGLRVQTVMTSCDFSAGDKESNIAWIARAIEIADLLGAPSVRIDSAMSKEKELNFEERVNLFVEGLGGALKRTENSKVTLGIENHGFQGNNLAFLLNVFMKTGSDRLGSTMDVGNFYWRGYPLSEVYGILRVLAPHAKHTHVKNIGSSQESVQCVVGQACANACISMVIQALDCTEESTCC
jgi:sugar phosphate isomerase/epimerase